MSEQRRVAVVGAGIAGVVAAYELASTAGLAVTLFEASHRLGGTVETVTIPSHNGLDAFVIETGPDSWVSDKSAARDLAVELGLEEELIQSNDHQRRNYLARGRQLTPMPDGMRMMVPTRWAPVLESPLFSWQARLAYLREPRRAEELKAFALARDTENPDADESVAAFVRRHFGDEATETIAGPLLAGVFGGDVETLSARAVLAPFVRMEHEHGSLITSVMDRAAKQKAERGAPQSIFTTLRSGLHTLVDRMADGFAPGTIRLGSRVTALTREPYPSRGWRLSVDEGAQRQEHDCDAVLLATPAHITRDLLAPLDSEAAALLPTEATSAIVVALAYAPESATRLRIPRGFGFLVPPAAALSDEPTLLAGTFMDQKFPHRAPQGGVFLRGFFGGQAAPRMMDWPDEQIAEAARAHFSRLVGPLPPPTHTVVRRWPRSLPQYQVGHVARMRALAGRLRELPGLGLTGNAYHGVGLPNLIDHGRTIARELANSCAHIAQ